MGALRTFVRLFVLGRRRGLRSRVRRRVWSMVGFGGQQESTVDHAGMNQQMKTPRRVSRYSRRLSARRDGL